MMKVKNKKLRILMVEYGVEKKEIAEAIGKSLRQTQKILHEEISKNTGKPYKFDIEEGYALVLLFRKKGEKDLTMEELFYPQMLSNESQRELQPA